MQGVHSHLLNTPKTGPTSHSTSLLHEKLSKNKQPGHFQNWTSSHSCHHWSHLQRTRHCRSQPHSQLPPSQNSRRLRSQSWKNSSTRDARISDKFGDSERDRDLKDNREGSGSKDVGAPSECEPITWVSFKVQPNKKGSEDPSDELRSAIVVVEEEKKKTGDEEKQVVATMIHNFYFLVNHRSNQSILKKGSILFQTFFSS